MIKSPLNYTGGKAKILNQILPLFPEKIDKFFDLFCGGCNVGINVSANHIYFNDLNKNLINLYKYLTKINIENIIDEIYKIINTYNLSLVSKNGYEFYKCNSSDGLGNYNRDKYNKLKNDYNSMKKNESAYIMLYVLIVYAFNNQIRFNKKGEFNLPVGKRDFNKNMEEKLISFVNELQTRKCTFSSFDFRTFDINKFSKDDFVYVDPPYLITCASYNEQNAWNDDDEISLLNFLDLLDDNNIKFGLSNVLTSKGKKNTILIRWLNRHNNYKPIHLDYNYSNCNYQIKNKTDLCDEVLIINY